MIAEATLTAVGTFGASNKQVTPAGALLSGGTLVSRNDQRLELLSAADVGRGTLTADQLLDCYEDVARMVLNSPAATSASQTYLLACRALQVQPDAAARLCCEATDVLANRRVSLAEENELKRVEEAERQAERALGADYWQSYKRSIEEALQLEDNRRKQADADEREAAMQEDYLYQNDRVVEQLRLQLSRAARAQSPSREGGAVNNDITAQEEQHLNHLNDEAIRIQKRINELRRNGIPSPCCDVCDSHNLEPKQDTTTDNESNEELLSSLTRRDYFLLAIAEDDTRCFIEDEEVQDRSLFILHPFYKSMELMAEVLTTSGGTLGWSTTMTQEVSTLTAKGLLPRLHPTQQRTVANTKNNTTPIAKRGPSSPTATASSGRYGSFPFPCYISGVYNQIALLVTLPSCTHLKFLDLSNSRITSPMAVTLTQVLLRKGCMVKLNVLVLDGNPIGSIAVEGLYSALQSHRSLHRISLLSGPQGIPSTTRKIEQLCTTRVEIAGAVEAITRGRDQCENVLEVGGRDEVRAEEVWGRRGLERMYASLLEGNVYALEGDGTMRLSAVSLAALEEMANGNHNNRVSSASYNNSTSRFAPPSPPHQSRPSESRGSARTVASSDAASSLGGSSSSSKRTDKSSKKDKHKKDKDKATKSKSKSSKSKK